MKTESPGKLEKRNKGRKKITQVKILHKLMRFRFSTGSMLIKNDFKIPLLVAGAGAGARFSVLTLKHFVG